MEAGSAGRSDHTPWERYHTYAGLVVGMDSHWVLFPLALVVRGFEEWVLSWLWLFSSYLNNNFSFDVDVCVLSHLAWQGWDLNW